MIIRIGHSPDPDDAFMFYGIAKGKVKLDGFQFRHSICDIQSLNSLAMKGDLEVTAISAAVYPLVSKRYWILSCGASVGRNYGPLVVAERKLSKRDLAGKRIAVPGMQTTAFLLLKIFLDDFIPVEMKFTDIIPALRRKEADAGLIIHEGQISFRSFGLQKCLDLGKVWHEEYSLPIPLGLDVVRKDLGLKTAKKLHQVLLDSIEYGMENEKDSVPYAMKYARGLKSEDTKIFVKMYVNRDTLDLGQEGARALKKLYRLGVKKGIFDSSPKIEIIS